MAQGHGMEPTAPMPRQAEMRALRADALPTTGAPTTSGFDLAANVHTGWTVAVVPTPNEIL